MSSFSVFFSSAAADVARSPSSLAPPTSHLRARPPVSFSAMCSLPSMPLIIRFLCFVFSGCDFFGLNGGDMIDLIANVSPCSSKMSGLLQPSSAQNRLGSQGSSSGLIVKRTMRVDIIVDQYPNFNFVGRLLGPRGNSLKRVEASAECRVLIKGHGSIKDPVKYSRMMHQARCMHDK